MTTRRDLIFYDQFILYWPSMKDHVIDYYVSGLNELTIFFDDGLRAIYNNKNKSVRSLYADASYLLPEDEWTKRFSLKLRTLIAQRGIAQSDLADNIGLTRAAVSNYVSGKRIPSSYVLSKIARCLNCSESELLYFESV